MTLLWKICELFILTIPLLLLVVVPVLSIVTIILREIQCRKIEKRYPIPYKNKRKSEDCHLLILKFFMARFSEDQQQIYDMKFKLEIEEMKQADDMLVKNVTTILIPVVSAVAALIAISISLKSDADYSMALLIVTEILVFALFTSFIEMGRRRYLNQIKIRLKYINQAIENSEKNK